jgi:regulator of protease activity HflC (stomatin/prohibitin superfamily)
MDPTLTSIFTYAAGGIGLITAAAFAKSMVYSVEQQTEKLITKFGKYVRTEKEPGLHVKLPAPFNRIAATVPTALQTATKPINVKTSENLFVDVPVSVQYQVNDSKKYYFDNDKPVELAMQLIDQSVRAHMSGKSFQDLYTGDRNAISDAVIADVANHVAEYGIVLRRIVIDQPNASAEVKAKYESVQTSAMGAQAAENEGRITIIQETSKAEGEKQRDWLRGDGAAGYRSSIFAQYGQQIKQLEDGGIDPADAAHMMLEIMRLDTYREVADKGNMVIVVPDAESGSAVGNVQAALKAAKKEPTPAPVSG